MENRKAQVSDDLVGELLQGVLDELKKLNQSVSGLSSQDQVKKLREALDAFEKRLTTARSTNGDESTAQLVAEFAQLKQLVRQRPDYTMSQYVRYGGYIFGLMVVLVTGLTWLALDWKGERDHFREAYWSDNWRVRFVKQQDPTFYSYIEGLFAKDPAGVSKWVVEQEQADEKRALATQAAEQAKALAEQANQLEGKAATKTTKKSKKRA